MRKRMPVCLLYYVHDCAVPGTEQLFLYRTTVLYCVAAIVERMLRTGMSAWTLCYPHCSCVLAIPCNTKGRSKPPSCDIILTRLSPKPGVHTRTHTRGNWWVWKDEGLHSWDRSRYRSSRSYIDHLDNLQTYLSGGDRLLGCDR